MLSFFFFQAEDGIRDIGVTGVQTCALPISGSLDLHRDLGLDPPERVLEGEVDVRLEVGAALGARLLPAGSAAEDAAEEVAQVADVEVEAPGSAWVEPAAAVGRAELVVRLPLLGIAEDVVRRLDLLEALLGNSIARILVRVVLAGEPPVGLLDLVGRRALRDAQDRVKVLSRRGHSRPQPLPAAAHDRRAGSPSGSPRSRRPPRRRTAGRAAPRGRGG